MVIYMSLCLGCHWTETSEVHKHPFTFCPMCGSVEVEQKEIRSHTEEIDKRLKRHAGNTRANHKPLA